MKKNVYVFGNSHADGSAENKNILGGKGANLAEMTQIGIPVPPGFTISTDVCNYFIKNNPILKILKMIYKKVFYLLKKIRLK